MELEELRTKWQSVKSHIDPQLNDEVLSRSVSKGKDAKSRLIKRSLWILILTFLCLILMATSRIWSPVKLPYWWIIIFCTSIGGSWLISLSSLYQLSKIDLCKNTNMEIFTFIIHQKRTYRNMELVVCSVVLFLFIWMSLSPSFINTWRMYYIWGLTLVGYVLEFLWYRSNQKLLDKIADRQKDQ